MIIHWGFHIFCFYFFFGSAYLLYIVCTHTHARTQVHLHYSQSLSCSRLHCSITCSCSLISFHKRCRDRAAACPTQSLQSSSAGFDGIDHFLETRPCLELFLCSKGTGNSLPLHYHEALSVPYASLPGKCSEEFDSGKVTAAWSSMWDQLQVRTGHSSMFVIWDQSISYALYSLEAPYWWFCMFLAHRLHIHKCI